MNDTLVDSGRLQIIASDSGLRFYLAMRAQAARAHSFERALVWLRLGHHLRAEPEPGDRRPSS